MPGPALSPLEQQLLKAKTTVRAEMPDVANAPIEPMGWLDQLIAGIKARTNGGTTLALAHPNGSIGVNDQASFSQSDLEDTLAHELTHVRQSRRDYGGKSYLSMASQYLTNRKESAMPYGQQPGELEAFQAEGDRAVKQGRAPGVTPNFSTTGYREKGDYVLPEAVKLLAGSEPGIIAENVRLLINQGYTPAEAIKRAQQNVPRK